jgi:hypothetical protein
VPLQILTQLSIEKAEVGSNPLLIYTIRLIYENISMWALCSILILKATLVKIVAIYQVEMKIVRCLLSNLVRLFDF